MAKLHLVDAFTDRPFTGNPAAVRLGTRPPDETWMRLVAREMNLSETAFLHPVEGGFSLRWFTPSAEVDLCGHATLAAAFVLWETGALPAADPARFLTRSGWLTCTREGEWIAMDFPALPCVAAIPPEGLAAALGSEPRHCAGNGMDLLVEIEDEAVLIRAPTGSRANRGVAREGPHRHRPLPSAGLRLRVAVLRPGRRGARGSRDRLGALRARAVLAGEVGPRGTHRFPGQHPRRRGPVGSARRPRRSPRPGRADGCRRAEGRSGLSARQVTFSRPRGPGA